jgi:uncharacterized membrane protein YdbT with pleckstrin-like domain
MGYIEQNLGTNEVLLAQARFHWLYRAGAAALLLAALGATGYLLTSVHSVWLGGAMAAAGIIAFLLVMVPVWTTEIGVTSQRLIIKRGLLSRRTDEIQLWAIEEANLEQSVLGRLLGFGRIEVQGTGDDALAIPAIADPLYFRKAIQDAIGRATRPSGPAPAGAPNSSAAV